ncbi:hypothetical protein BD779DRAFT_1506980 [Infundibulicybe gibba]|nr:hypothetical protein BD779DRAFT_1506980 [Infundibulicybe gibba]
MVALIIVMGVSGTGTYGMPYIEGDDLHPKSNPLTDADREPWLELIRNIAERTGVVISCSALKRYYRDILRGERKLGTGGVPILLEAVHSSTLPTFFVFINGPRDKRSGHFMKVSMLDSQLETLESPRERMATEVQVREAKRALESMPGN